MTEHMQIPPVVRCGRAAADVPDDTDIAPPRFSLNAGLAL
jgi:hypothetical protein